MYAGHLRSIINLVDVVIVFVVSSGCLAVNQLALGAKGHRFDCRKKSKHFQIFISRLTTSWVSDQVKWAVVSTELLKIKGDV